MKKFLALSSSNVVFIMQINVKMVGILTFMSRINFVLSRVEHGKSCITSGPDCYDALQSCTGHIITWCALLKTLPLKGNKWKKGFLTPNLGIKNQGLEKRFSDR